MQRLLLTIILFVFSLQLQGQVFPKEGSTLNYRIIGFSFPGSEGTTDYRLEIAAGNYNNEDSFKKNIILSPVGKSAKLITEVPAFGQRYTWRVVYKHNRDDVKKSDFYHFSTGIRPALDTAQRRLSILQPATSYKDAYACIDGIGVIYDMADNPVWYLPDSAALAGSAGDIKVTPQGTLTYIVDIAGYETDYNGKNYGLRPPTTEIQVPVSTITNLHAWQMVITWYLVLTSYGTAVSKPKTAATSSLFAIQ